jgi:hypothetical protein
MLADANEGRINFDYSSGETVLLVLPGEISLFKVGHWRTSESLIRILSKKNEALHCDRALLSARD